MVHHSSIFAWEIPWTEKPGYSPWGHKKVRHNLATKEQQYFQRQIKIFCKVLLYSEKKNSEDLLTLSEAGNVLDHFNTLRKILLCISSLLLSDRSPTTQRVKTTLLYLAHSPAG